MGIVWVLELVQESHEHVTRPLFSSTVLYRMWFGAPCLEVDAPFVQAGLDELGAALEAHGALHEISCPALNCIPDKPYF